MPVILLLIGAVILITVFNGKSDELAGLIKGEFTGPNNFTKWLLAFAIIGLFSYVPGFRPVANAFFALVIVAMLIGQGGFFEKLSAALNSAGK